MKKSNCLVLLSTYNGEKYIKELLNSVLTQKNVDISILIRDDGSTDSTISILKEYSENNSNISYFTGKNLGYAKSFWQLLKKAEGFDYYALCDQDDIWIDKKIESAINLINLKQKNNLPILYTSNVIPINNNLEELPNLKFKFEKTISIYESLQKSILPGCTFVFNSYALNYIKKYDGFMESHDWAIYNIINAFGIVIYDSKSYIYYRIHDENAIGSQSIINLYKIKILRFFKKSNCVRSHFAKDFYLTYHEIINNEILSESIKQLAYYREKKFLKIKLLLNKNYTGIIFKLYVLFNKV